MTYWSPRDLLGVIGIDRLQTVRPKHICFVDEDDVLTKLLCVSETSVSTNEIIKVINYRRPTANLFMYFYHEEILSAISISAVKNDFSKEVPSFIA